MDFFFVFSHDSSTIHDDDTGDDSDLVLSPLFQWGRGETDKDRYFAFFPFFGKMKSKLSWGEINFFLFPVYVDWSHKEFKARSLFYPLILWGSSDVRKEYRFYLSIPGKLISQSLSIALYSGLLFNGERFSG